jgi:hypothetical protein
MALTAAGKFLGRIPCRRRLTGEASRYQKEVDRGTLVASVGDIRAGTHVLLFFRFRSHEIAAGGR